MTDIPQSFAHRWEVLHSMQYCCTSRWPAPNGPCRRWATPGLLDAGWSDRRARRPHTSPPGWATTSPSGSWCYSWTGGEKYTVIRDLLQMRVCRLIPTGLTFHRSYSSRPSKVQGLRTIRSLLVRCWCWQHRSCCVPGDLRDRCKLGNEELIILLYTHHTNKNLMWFFHHSGFKPFSYNTIHMTFTLLEGVITWYSAARDFHVQLNRVHTQDGVAHMAEQVSSGHDSGEGRQFTQLLQLLLPPGGESGHSTALARH